MGYHYYTFLQNKWQFNNKKTSLKVDVAKSVDFITQLSCSGYNFVIIDQINNSNLIISTQ